MHSLFGTLIIAALPWLLGVVALCNIDGIRRFGLDVQLIFIGVAGTLGYVSVAALMWLALEAGFSPFSLEFLWGAGVIFLLGFFRLIYCMGVKPLEVIYCDNDCGMASLLLIVTVVLIAISIWQHRWLPTQGWDVLDRWSLEGVRLLNYLEGEKIKEFRFLSKKHPGTQYFILAWSGWASQTLGMMPLI